MRLIGKLDSPYVRRVAISLHLLDLPFTHDDLSVFTDYAAFEAINPVVKAPSLVMDDGTVLLDSTLILDVVERASPSAKRLSPTDPTTLARHHRIVGLALAACEKTVQIAYEHRLRPEDKRHQPWLDRVGTQLAQAYDQLEAALERATPWLFGAHPLQADVTATVAWGFTQAMLPDRLEPARHSRLASLSAQAEALPSFRAAAPH